MTRETIVCLTSGNRLRVNGAVQEVREAIRAGHLVELAEPDAPATWVAYDHAECFIDGTPRRLATVPPAVAA